MNSEELERRQKKRRAFEERLIEKEEKNALHKIQQYKEKLEAEGDSQDKKVLSRKHYYIGKIYKKVGKHTEAVRSFSKAILLDPEFSDAYYDRARERRKLELFEVALWDIKKAIELGKNDAMTFCYAGMLAQELGKTFESLEYFSKAQELDPKNSYVFYQKAILLKKIGDLESALTCTNSALEISPHEAKYFVLKATILKQLDRITASFENLEKALEENPEFIPAHLELARMYKEKQEVKKAISEYEKIFEKDEEQEEVLSELFRLYSKIQNWEKAEKFYKIRLELQRKRNRKSNRGGDKSF